jgi:hypothetical protein
VIAATTERHAPDWSGRLRHVRDHCARHGLDAFIVSTPHNLT